jgi:hypothetical protein
MDMYEVIKVYGKTIFQAVILVGLLCLLFQDVMDENGNRGILKIVSDHTEMQTENPADFETFCEESQKSPPYFVTVETGYLETGQYELTDIVKAWDYAGNELQVCLLKVISPDGTILENELDFQESGVYELNVMAADHENRVRYAAVSIPVNRS